MKKFTKEELAKYNGENNTPAYISFKKNIYDVSNLEHWKNGQHFRGAHAGIEVDEFLEKSVHGIEKINNLKKIGELTD